MPPSAIGHTPYPYVNAAVDMLLTEVKAVLGDYFLGLYLHGSLALGDFDPGHSDIDFLVVTSRRLPVKTLFPDLEAMHLRIMRSGLKWAKKLEGAYLSRKALLRYKPGRSKIPYLNGGKFFLTTEGIDWIINRHILRENGITVAGPPIRSLIAPVNQEEIRRAVVEGIWTEWRLKEDDRDWLKPPGHQPFVVLTNCRALYTMKTGTVATKTVSARWALKALESEWTDLIRAAMEWHYGKPTGDIENTLRMMRYTLEQAEKYRGRFSYRQRSL